MFISIDCVNYVKERTLTFPLQVQHRLRSPVFSQSRLEKQKDTLRQNNPHFNDGDLKPYLLNALRLCEQNYNQHRARP